MQCYDYPSIKEKLGIPDSNSKDITKKFVAVGNGSFAKSDAIKDFVPQLYNIWNFAAKGTFGSK